MPGDLLHILSRLPVFVLVFFRLAGMMLYAPLFGSPRIPRRVRLLLVLVLAFGLCGTVAAVPLPQSIWDLAVAIGGEMAFGLAMGMVMSFVFVAAQWAGEMVGQQMGLDMAQVFDPQFGSQGSIIGDLYFMLTLVVFLTLRGHHAMLDGVRASFDKVPLLSLGMDRPLFDLLIDLLSAGTTLALRLASPILITMLVVDLALGLIGRAMPQFNVMQAGQGLRPLIGTVVVIAGLLITVQVVRVALDDSINTTRAAWAAPPVSPELTPSPLYSGERAGVRG